MSTGVLAAKRSKSAECYLIPPQSNFSLLSNNEQQIATWFRGRRNIFQAAFFFFFFRGIMNMTLVIDFVCGWLITRNSIFPLCRLMEQGYIFFFPQQEVCGMTDYFKHNLVTSCFKWMSVMITFLWQSSYSHELTGWLLKKVKIIELYLEMLNLNQVQCRYWNVYHELLAQLITKILFDSAIWLLYKYRF